MTKVLIKESLLKYLKGAKAIFRAWKNFIRYARQVDCSPFLDKPFTITDKNKKKWVVEISSKMSYFSFEEIGYYMELFFSMHPKRWWFPYPKLFGRVAYSNQQDQLMHLNTKINDLLIDKNSPSHDEFLQFLKSNSDFSALRKSLFILGEIATAAESVELELRDQIEDPHPHLYTSPSVPPDIVKLLSRISTDPEEHKKFFDRDYLMTLAWKRFFIEKNDMIDCTELYFQTDSFRLKRWIGRGKIFKSDRHSVEDIKENLNNVYTETVTADKPPTERLVRTIKEILKISGYVELPIDKDCFNLEKYRLILYYYCFWFLLQSHFSLKLANRELQEHNMLEREKILDYIQSLVEREY